MDAQRRMTACFSGYRPPKLPWGEREGDPRCEALKERLARAIVQAYARGFRRFITGMAEGVDLYAAEAVLAAKSGGLAGVELICALPYPKDAGRNSRAARILAAADETIVCSPVYTPYCMHIRNHYMVDHSALLIAVYDGKAGGTKNTLAYAAAQGVEYWTIVP